jgi:hypothetical protein
VEQEHQQQPLAFRCTVQISLFLLVALEVFLAMAGEAVLALEFRGLQYLRH